MKRINRRKALKISGAAISGSVFSAKAIARESYPSEKKLKILVTGAHPDDPETGCGGTIARYTDMGHEVTLLYLTKGEAGIEGASHQEAARIRTREAEAANKILNTTPRFLGQVDGATEVTAMWYEKIIKILEVIDPDIVFTHWPIDTHRDHRICSILTYDAWLKTGKKISLYYYEVMTGNQSQNFHPTDYVDISPVVETKWESCFVHKSQKIKETYSEDHGKMEQFRGLEFGCSYAEGFVHHQQSPIGYLPNG